MLTDTLTQPTFDFPEPDAPTPPITREDIEALAAWEQIRRFRARYCMGEQKLEVAASLGLTFEDVNLPWPQWLELWLWWRDGVVPC